jgi:hypothetical protein
MVLLNRWKTKSRNAIGSKGNSHPSRRKRGNYRASIKYRRVIGGRKGDIDL